jgi:hypothetical protein
MSPRITNVAEDPSLTEVMLYYNTYNINYLMSSGGLEVSLPPVRLAFAAARDGLWINR